MNSEQFKKKEENTTSNADYTRFDAAGAMYRI